MSAYYTVINVDDMYKHINNSARKTNCVVIIFEQNYLRIDDIFCVENFQSLECDNNEIVEQFFFHL